MAYADTEFVGTRVRQAVKRPFIALDHMISALAKAVVMAEAANRIVDMSDAQLAAKGVTRVEAIQKLLSN